MEASYIVLFAVETSSCLRFLTFQNLMVPCFLASCKRVLCLALLSYANVFSSALYAVFAMHRTTPVELAFACLSLFISHCPVTSTTTHILAAFFSFASRQAFPSSRSCNSQITVPITKIRRLFQIHQAGNRGLNMLSWLVQYEKTRPASWTPSKGNNFFSPSHAFL